MPTAVVGREQDNYHHRSIDHDHHGLPIMAHPDGGILAQFAMAMQSGENFVLQQVSMKKSWAWPRSSTTMTSWTR